MLERSGGTQAKTRDGYAQDEGHGYEVGDARMCRLGKRGCKKDHYEKTTFKAIFELPLF